MIITIKINDVVVKTILKRHMLEAAAYYCPYIPLTTSGAIVDSITLTNVLSQINLSDLQNLLNR